MKSFITSALIVLTVLSFFMIGICQAQDTGSGLSYDSSLLTTQFAGISFQELNAKLVLDYRWDSKDGAQGVSTDMAIPFATYSRKTGYTILSGVTTFQRQQIASIGLLTDVNKHYDVYVSAKLTPLKDMVDKKLGIGGDFQIPIVSVIMTKFFDPEAVLFAGKNIQNGAWEAGGGIVVFQASSK